MQEPTAAAIPKMPMTVRMRMVGKKGTRHPRAPGLTKVSFGGDC